MPTSLAKLNSTQRDCPGRYRTTLATTNLEIRVLDPRKWQRTGQCSFCISYGHAGREEASRCSNRKDDRKLMHFDNDAERDKQTVTSIPNKKKKKSYSICWVNTRLNSIFEHTVRKHELPGVACQAGGNGCRPYILWNEVSIETFGSEQQEASCTPYTQQAHAVPQQLRDFFLFF